MISTQRCHGHRSRLVPIAVAVALSLSACTLVPRRWGHPVTVTEVVVLSQHGVAPGAIVEKLRRGGTVVLLTEEQLSALRLAGVTPVVIDYLRASYEEAAAKHPQLRDDEDLSCFYLGPDEFWYAGGPWGFHPDC